MKAAHSLPLLMRPAGFLLSPLAALALASCAAPPPPPPPTASVPPPAPTEQAPPPAAPAQAQAPFITPEQMAASVMPRPEPLLSASPPPAQQSPTPPPEPPVNTRVADLLNSADTEQRGGGGDGCFYVNLAVINANTEPTPTAQRAELKRYADRCRLRFQP